MPKPYTCHHTGRIPNNSSGTFILKPTVSYTSTSASAKVPASAQTPISALTESFIPAQTSTPAETPIFAPGLPGICIDKDL